MQWYEWVFSGVGGAALLAVLGFLFRLLWRRTPETFNQTVTSRDGTSIPVSSSPGAAVFSAPVEGSVIAVGTNISQVFVESLHHHAAGTPEPVLHNTEPTPLQIYNDVRNVLPYDKQAASENTLGSMQPGGCDSHPLVRLEKLGVLPATLFRITDQ
jgi:hypothetical protein